MKNSNLQSPHTMGLRKARWRDINNLCHTHKPSHTYDHCRLTAQKVATAAATLFLG